VSDLNQETLHAWLADLHTVPSIFTGNIRSVATIAAYARSVRAFCSWLVHQGLVTESPFPPGAVPKAPEHEPQVVEAKAFARLLEVCQGSATSGSRDQGMMLRDRAILWLILDAGLSVSDVCGLRLGDVSRAKGTVTVQGKGRRTRTLPLSEKGQRVVSAYLEHARLTPAWSPATPEAQEPLLLTELRSPLTKNSLTLLFLRLNQRAGFTTRPICPSMLRDTYAIRFLQAGGDLALLQEQLGVADSASLRRYQRFCDGQRRAEAGVQVGPEEQAQPPRPARRSKGKRRKARRRR